MKKIISLLVTVVFFISAGFSQSNFSIRGKIIDEVKKGLANVTVTLLSNNDSTKQIEVLSNNEGNFKISPVKSGVYFLRASAVGHVSKSIAVTITSKNITIPLISLLLQPKELAQVTVISKKSFIEHKLDKTIINVDAAITSAGNTAMEVLEKSPGVSVDKDGNISLKGKQGVIILIDGKQTFMGAQDLANYLHGMAAANIDQIELMPNPSSKYDAAGNSGIINIKTKKNRQKGFNGSINSSAGAAKYGRTFNSLNLNYRTGKFNLFSNVGVNARKYWQELTIHREYFDDNRIPAAIFDQQVSFLKKRSNENFKLGVDFYASKQTTFGMVLSGFLNPVKQTGENLSFLKNGEGRVGSILQSSSYDDENQKNASVNLNFRHAFDSAGTEITADVDVLRYKGIHVQTFISNNFDPAWVKQSAETLESDLPSLIDIYAAKSDFVHSFRKGMKLEAGVKSSYVKTDNFAGYYNVENGNATIDYEKSNHFKYSENINAGYLNMSRELKKWNFQGGLRIENTNYSGNQFGNPLHADSSFQKSYTGLFPTFFAGYKLNANNDFGFSYGRRISRPDYESLNPFIFYIDKYTYEAGNPFLKPMYANSFELTHSYKGKLNSSLNYTHNRDLFNEAFTQSGYATIVSQTNFGTIEDVSFSVNAQVNPKKWWTIISYAECDYNRVNSILAGHKLQTQGFNFRANLNNQFKLGKEWSAETSGFIRTAMTRGQFKMSEVKQLNAGVAKQILKKKGTLKLNVNDIFKSNKQSGLVKLPNTDAYFTQRSDSRNISLSFNLRFGKPMKTQQRRLGCAGDEQSRIKSGN